MAAAMPLRTRATTHGRYRPGLATKTSSTRFAIPNFRLPASATSGGRMAVKRVRAAVTGLQDERNRLGWRPVASAPENGRWRLLDGPVCARSPLDLASILSSRHRPLAIAPTGQLVGVAT